MTTNLVIVEKGGNLKDVKFKNFDINTLYKKCSFRKSEGFALRHKYEKIKYNGEKYDIHVYSRNNGKSGTENKYDMPPPIDNELYFGSFALVRYCPDEDNYIDFTVEEWKPLYEKLFGGFEDLSITAIDDANESDELDDISPSMKTKQGYLKDGFVVDSNEDEDAESDNSDIEDDKNDHDDDDDDDDDDENGDNHSSMDWDDDDDDDDDEDDEDEDELELEDDFGSELEEDEFIYSDED